MGIRITPMYVSVAALAVALVSLIFAVLTYRRAGARMRIGVSDVLVRTKPLDLQVRLHVSSRGLAEMDIVRISFWMFYKQWPLAKRFIEGEGLPARIKANSGREWSISVLDAVAAAYRSQVEEMGKNERRYMVKFILLIVVHYSSYLFIWMPSVRTMLPPTLLIEFGNGLVAKKTVWRAALALTNTKEISEYALRPKPSIR